MRETRNLARPPADFEDFWSATLDELLTVKAKPEHEAPLGPRPQLIRFRSLNDALISAWVAQPAEPNDTSPLVITCHGYGGAIAPERIRRLASRGFSAIGVDVRGFGRSRDAIVGLSPYGYVVTGVDSPLHSILRGAVCDYIQAYRVALALGYSPQRVVFQGFSFAGGLALMAAAVLAMSQGANAPRGPRLIALGAPTFGHLKLRLQKCESGSGKQVAEYIDEHPSLAAKVENTLSYFDATFFAPFLLKGNAHPHVKILGGVGLHDPIVPAETVFAIFNALEAGPALQILEMPCSHTDRPEEAAWLRWEKAWLNATKNLSKSAS